MSKEFAKLAEKIALISSELGKIEMDGYNDHSRYGFISHEQITVNLRNLLLKHKVTIFPDVVDFDEVSSISQKGKETIRTKVKMEFTIVDTETGFSTCRKFSGADQDTGGKSMSQAITEAVKRFELKLFHISSKDDIDPDSKTTEVVPEKPKKKPQSKKDREKAEKDMADSKESAQLRKEIAELNKTATPEQIQKMKEIANGVDRDHLKVEQWREIRALFTLAEEIREDIKLEPNPGITADTNPNN